MPDARERAEAAYEARPMVGIVDSPQHARAWMVVERDLKWRGEFDDIIAWSYQKTPEGNEACARRVAAALNAEAGAAESAAHGEGAFSCICPHSEAEHSIVCNACPDESAARIEALEAAMTEAKEDLGNPEMVEPWKARRVYEVLRAALAGETAAKEAHDG